jgi:putative ATP-binding cassette transporter
MSFISLLLDEAGPRRKVFLLWMALSSVSLAGIVVVVNTVIDNVASPAINLEHVGLFALLCFGTLYGQIKALGLASEIVEGLLNKIRLRYADLVAQTNLDTIQRLGPTAIHDTLLRETTILSEASTVITYGILTGVAMVMSGFYIATLSLFGFGVVAALFVLAAIAYRYSQRHSADFVRQANSADSLYFDLFSDMVNGFKEVKMDWRRARDITVDHLARRSALTEHSRRHAANQINYGLSVSHASYYLLLATVVFLLPQYIGAVTATKIVYVVLFLMSALNTVMRSLPMLLKANIALDNLRRQEAELAEMGLRPDDLPTAIPSFESVEMRGLVHVYPGEDARSSITIGPCDLALAPGEIVFLVGGNGSGKSTLLRLATRLYEPQAGSILWDGQLVTATRTADYRRLFATVFSDFHLFDRLYGNESVDPAKVRGVLKRVKLDDRVDYADGRFSTVALSTGQRRRLALAVALLEDKPILILDEFAADQDPDFRSIYYEELLPGLRKARKTVVAVSHDDRYFHLADRVLWMRDGRLTDGAF